MCSNPGEHFQQALNSTTPGIFQGIPLHTGKVTEIKQGVSVKTYEAWLLNNETVIIKNIVLKFMYVASYLLQSSSLGLLYTAACVPSMRGNISGNHFV
jgi:hypothetical protein